MRLIDARNANRVEIRTPLFGTGSGDLAPRVKTKWAANEAPDSFRPDNKCAIRTSARRRHRQRQGGRRAWVVRLPLIDGVGIASKPPQHLYVEPRSLDGRRHRVTGRSAPSPRCFRPQCGHLYGCLGSQDAHDASRCDDIEGIDLVKCDVRDPKPSIRHLVIAVRSCRLFRSRMSAMPYAS
jgi:hypothetical protein